MTTHPASVVIAAATYPTYLGVPQPTEWGKDPDIPGVIFARWHFENGFGASVIAGPALGYVELAVLDINGNLTYTTTVTDDVLHPETEAELIGLLREIMAL